MSSKWTYKQYDNTDVTKVLNDMTSEIGTISTTSIEALMTKVTVSDQQDGDARGIVFFYTGQVSSAPALPGDVTWKMKENTSGSDYTKLYNDVTDTLDSFTGDNFYQAFYAYVNMTNRKGGDATIEVWYPEPADA